LWGTLYQHVPPGLKTGGKLIGGLGTFMANTTDNLVAKNIWNGIFLPKLF